MAARWGLWGGLAAFVVMLLVPAPEGMSPAAWRTTAIIVLMACWWMTEALPLTATALVPFLAFP
jgi:sodium-dependent dicarboxylate transporter 2/3/5